MLKKLTFTSLALSSSLTLAIDDPMKWERLIDSEEYGELKTELYEVQPDVLSRTAGTSIFDMAINLKNKRASIIIAEYHNFTIKNAELDTIYSRINQLREEMKMDGDVNIQGYLNETLSLIEELDKRLKMLEEHNEFLEGKVVSLTKSNTEMLDFMNEGLSTNSTDLSSVSSMAQNNDKVIQDLLEKVKGVEGKILSEEEALEYLQEGFNFAHEPALIVEEQKVLY